MTRKQQEQLISDTKKIEQFKIVNKIDEIKKRVNNGEIDVYGFYNEIRLLKEDLENGIFLRE